MSENVEIVRDLWRAWERGDMKAVFEFYDTDVEWDMARSEVPDLGKFHGRDGVRDFFRQWAYEMFDDYYAEPVEITAVGDKVVVELRQGGRGKGSGVDVEMPRSWLVYSLRGDKVARVRVFRDHEEALRIARQEDPSARKPNESVSKQ